MHIGKYLWTQKSEDVCNTLTETVFLHPLTIYRFLLLLDSRAGWHAMRKVHAHMPAPQAAPGWDSELAEAEIISSCTAQPSLPYTHNTNNAVSVPQSDVTSQMWVTPARNAAFDFCYLGQSSLLCRGEQPPDEGRKDLTGDYISSANLQERLI